jgi:hypothetical protein
VRVGNRIRLRGRWDCPIEQIDSVRPKGTGGEAKDRGVTANRGDGFQEARGMLPLFLRHLPGTTRRATVDVGDISVDGSLVGSSGGP